MTTTRHPMRRLLVRGACAALVAGGAAAGKTARAQATDAPDAGPSGGAIVGTVQIASAKRAQTVVYLEEVKGKEFKAEKTPVLHQQGKAFVPGVLVVQTGTSVEFTNDDSFDHNVFSPDFPPNEKPKGKSYYDLGTWGKGEKRTRVFKQPGVYTQLCSIHPEMVGYIVVLQNPYYAIVDKEGRFRIPGVPAGQWKLKVWNERLRPKQLSKSYAVTVAAGADSDVPIE